MGKHTQGARHRDTLTRWPPSPSMWRRKRGLEAEVGEARPNRVGFLKHERTLLLINHLRRRQ